MGYHNSKTPEKDRDRLRTPPFVYGYLDAIYRFDIDLACESANCLHAAGVGYKFDLGEDALAADWVERGRTGFLNPPYSNIPPWIQKAAEQAASGFTTVMWLPSMNGDQWAAAVQEKATSIGHVIGRVSHLLPSGKPRRGNNRGSIIVEISPRKFGPATHYTILRDDMKRAFLDDVPF